MKKLCQQEMEQDQMVTDRVQVEAQETAEKAAEADHTAKPFFGKSHLRSINIWRLVNYFTDVQTN